MNFVKKFNEMKNTMNIITRDDEINIIAYKIPNSNHIIIGKTQNKKWLVKSTYDIILLSTKEIEEMYNLDLIESDLERLTWTA